MKWMRSSIHQKRIQIRNSADYLSGLVVLFRIGIITADVYAQVGATLQREGSSGGFGGRARSEALIVGGWRRSEWASGSHHRCAFSPRRHQVVSSTRRIRPALGRASCLNYSSGRPYHRIWILACGYLALLS
jgi:hypothetical protein